MAKMNEEQLQAALDTMVQAANGSFIDLFDELASAINNYGDLEGDERLADVKEKCKSVARLYNDGDEGGKGYKESLDAFTKEFEKAFNLTRTTFDAGKNEDVKAQSMDAKMDEIPEDL